MLEWLTMLILFFKTHFLNNIQTQTSKCILQIWNIIGSQILTSSSVIKWVSNKLLHSIKENIVKFAEWQQIGDVRPSYLLNLLQQTTATNDESLVRRHWIKRLFSAARTYAHSRDYTEYNTITIYNSQWRRNAYTKLYIMW